MAPPEPYGIDHMLVQAPATITRLRKLLRQCEQEDVRDLRLHIHRAIGQIERAAKEIGEARQQRCKEHRMIALQCQLDAGLNLACSAHGLHAASRVIQQRGGGGAAAELIDISGHPVAPKHDDDEIRQISLAAILDERRRQKRLFEPQAAGAAAGATAETNPAADSSSKDKETA